MSEDPIVILSAARTATGNFGGVFKDVSATALGTHAMRGALLQSQVEASQIDSVIMGCVLPAGLGQAPARQSALGAKLDKHCTCTTINKMCGSGMQAIMLAHDNLVANSADIMIAGGMENMSRAPYLLPRARFGYRLGHEQVIDHMMMDGLEDAYEPGKAMGCFAEQCVEKFKFTREQQDEYALRSLERARRAQDDGDFAEEIIPIDVKQKKETRCVDQDEGPTTAKPEKIPKLSPAFMKDGTITAANASSISDGAAALVLTRASIAKKLNLKPMATIRAHATHAQAPEWFTTAPISAINAVLEKTAWGIDEVDLFEINEAFAVVAMAAITELKLDPEKVNVNGGACVLGHPIGASGARITVTLLHALRRRGLRRGIASLCIGGGEATALAIELNSA